MPDPGRRQASVWVVNISVGSAILARAATRFCTRRRISGSSSTISRCPHSSSEPPGPGYRPPAFQQVCFVPPADNVDLVPEQGDNRLQHGAEEVHGAEFDGIPNFRVPCENADPQVPAAKDVRHPHVPCFCQSLRGQTLTICPD